MKLSRRAYCCYKSKAKEIWNTRDLRNINVQNYTRDRIMIFESRTRCDDDDNLLVTCKCNVGRLCDVH